MTNIYDQHRAAFSNVSAYCIIRDGERIASIAFKFPRDGAGRLYCYLHIFGSQMTRGFAGGYGYDKRSAATEFGCRETFSRDARLEDLANIDAIKSALSDIGGSSWDRELEKAGFTVLQAV